MRIGGFLPFSMIDYPGKLAAVVFTQGCNFRCPFCHNPSLLDASLPGRVSEQEIFAFLSRRRGLLEGVVVTGGEPTIQTDLPEFMGRVKALGFLIKLDTNGSHPEMLERILQGGWVDFVEMDLKAPWDRYFAAAGVAVDAERLQRSLAILRSSGISFGLRTTAVEPLHSDGDLLRIGREARGAASYALQEFRNGTLVCPEFAKKARAFPRKALEHWAHRLSGEGIPAFVR